MTRLTRQFVYSIALLLFSTMAFAQVYPVQASVVFNTPYSTQISDYATSMDVRMQLLINTSDITINNRQVRLKMFLQGNGINAQSSDFITGMQPLYINGGELVSLTNLDIAPLFKLENLQGISAVQYANPLPEGMYSICFEIYDVLTNQRLSQKSCANIYLMLNDPPLLNIPARNEQIAVTDFPNILFTWTPRQVNATNVSYQFEIREIQDPTLDPQIGFVMAPNLYEETVYSTALVYDLGKPNLMPNKRYAWRVRAISTSGLSANAVFKNDGYSEIYHFTYASNCPAPGFLLSEALSTRSVRLSWMGDASHTKYHVQYRKKEVANAEWFEVYTMNTQTNLSDLEAGVSYEFRVGASCDAAVMGNFSFTYSGINTFSMPTQSSDATNFSCGLNPAVAISNQTPLTNMVVSETFTAGDFPVKVLELQGHNPYSGKGYIIVPYLADTKIAVIFNNITINTSYQLINGVVETSYNPQAPNISDVEDLTGGANGTQVTQSVPFPITNITTNPNGDIIVSGANGEQVTIPGGSNVVLTGGDGQVYNIDSNGNPSGPFSPAPGGASTPQNTDGVAQNGQATQFTAQGITVAFEATTETKYSWDTVPPNAPSYITAKYAKVGSQYLGYKAIVNRQTDVLKAKISLTDTNIVLDSLIFKTQNGVLIEKTKQGNDFILQLKGTQTYAEEEIQAVIKQGSKYKIAGAFRLVHISEKQLNITLVPLNNTTSIPSSATTNLQAIYDKAGVKLTIKTAPVVAYNGEADGKITTSESGVFDYYTDEEKTINAKIKALPAYEKQTYYLIYSDLPSSKGIEGFMALGGQFGFVFPNAEAKTAAHEFAHGAFALEHPFTNNSDKGKTSFLMDYGSETVLWHQDWAQINNPQLKFYGFQTDSQGEFTNANLTPDWEPFTFTESSTYVSDDGAVTEPNGAVFGISMGTGVNRKNYKWGTIDNVKGYYYNNAKPALQIAKITNPTDKLIVDLYWNNGACGYNENFTTTWEHIKDKKGTVTLDYLATPNLVTAHRVIPCVSEGVTIGQSRYDLKCENKPFSEIHQKVQEYSAFAAAVASKTAAETVLLVLGADYCALKDITIENKLILTDKILNKTTLLGDDEKAIIKLFNVIKEQEINKLYDFITANNRLSNLLTNIDNSFLFIFGDDNRNYLLETLAYQMAMLKEDTKKWVIVNAIIKNRYTKINQGDFEKKALTDILSSMEEYTSQQEKMGGSVELLGKMLIEECRHLTNFKIILEIAMLRLEDKEGFSNFTQGELPSVIIPGLIMDTSCFVADSNNHWSWVQPGEFNITCTGGQFKQIYQSQVETVFAWAKYLKQNPSVKNSLSSNPAGFMNTFKTELVKYASTRAAENSQFWDNVTVSCNTLLSILEQVSLKENTQSLSNVSAAKKLSVIESYFTCASTTTINFENTENAIIKLVSSFEKTDRSILYKLETIGFDKIINKLSGTTLSKFLVWTGGQVYSTGHMKPLNASDLLVGENMKNPSQMPYKLEANLLDFDNFKATPQTKTKLKVEGSLIDYNQLIVVYVSDDFTFLGQLFKKGSVLTMPLIQAFALSNSNRNNIATKSAWIAVDVVLMFTGVGEIKVILTAGNYVRTAIVLSDIVGSAAGIALNAMDESSLDPDTRFKLQMLSIVASLPQAARLIKGVDNMIVGLDTKLNQVTNAQTKNGLIEYFASVKAKLPMASNITALINKIKNTTLFTKYTALSPEMKALFESDFANSGDDVIDLLKKQDSELFEGWQKFRSKHAGDFICN